MCDVILEWWHSRLSIKAIHFSNIKCLHGHVKPQNPPLSSYNDFSCPLVRDMHDGATPFWPPLVSVKEKTDVVIRRHLENNHMYEASALAAPLRFELSELLHPSVVECSFTWNIPHETVLHQRRVPVHIHRCRWVGDAVNSPVDEWTPCPCVATLRPAAARMWCVDVWHVCLFNYGAALWSVVKNVTTCKK